MKLNMSAKVIAVDFDGTLCENKWPDIGEPNNEIIEYIKDERRNGAKIVLWTCRDGLQLTYAVNWCTQQGIYFDTINRNVKEAIELFGADTRKVCADEYIDDHNLTKFKLPFNAVQIGETNK